MIGTKFNKPITEEQLSAYSQAADWCNENDATIVDQGDYYEVVEIPAPTQEELNAMEIERLKAELAATDYMCLKYVDGALTASEYAEARAYRASLRARINALEK